VTLILTFPTYVPLNSSASIH